MPTIDRVQGFNVVIFRDEPANERPHVHFIKGRNDAKVWLDNLTFAKTDRYSKSDLRKIVTTYLTPKSPLRVERGHKNTSWRRMFSPLLPLEKGQGMRLDHNFHHCLSSYEKYLKSLPRDTQPT